MTATVTHLWRLLKWGRTLGPARRLARDRGRSADARRRFADSSGSPDSGLAFRPFRDYAAALQAIGPAAIKLGQALSTRPDLVGAKAAENLSQLQDNLPPAPFAAIKQTIETSFGAPIESLFSEFRREADRRSFDSAGA